MVLDQSKETDGRFNGGLFYGNFRRKREENLKNLLFMSYPKSDLNKNCVRFMNEYRQPALRLCHSKLSAIFSKFVYNPLPGPGYVDLGTSTNTANDESVWPRYSTLTLQPN